MANLSGTRSGRHSDEYSVGAISGVLAYLVVYLSLALPLTLLFHKFTNHLCSHFPVFGFPFFPSLVSNCFRQSLAKATLGKDKAQTTAHVFKISSE